jgi:hypothetical protein
MGTVEIPSSIYGPARPYPSHASREDNKEVDVPYKTIEEVQQALRERGLPVERIDPMLEFEPRWIVSPQTSMRR